MKGNAGTSRWANRRVSLRMSEWDNDNFLDRDNKASALCKMCCSVLVLLVMLPGNAKNVKNVNAKQ
jgi:hypothetical protein